MKGVIKMKKIMTVLITICMIISAVGMSTTEVNAASKIANPKITKATSNTSSVSLTWNKAKGAKKYQVATVSYKWKKYKKVAKTNANKKKFTKTGKYKVVVSGKKYQVYKVSKVNYKNKKTLTKNTYTWKKLKSNTTYTFAVRAINGKRSSKWVVKVITTKKPSNNNPKGTNSNNGSGNSGNTENNTGNTTCTHNWVDKTTSGDARQGKEIYKCSKCKATKTLYAKWIKTQDAIPQTTEYPEVITAGATQIRCYSPDCTENSHRHVKCDLDDNDGDGYVDGMSNIYICWINEALLEKAGFKSREEAREFIKKHNEIFGTNYYTDIDLAEEFLANYPHLDYTIDYVLDNDINKWNGDHSTAGMVADKYSEHNIGQQSINPTRTHIAWVWPENLYDWRNPKVIPAQKEKGYWDFDIVSENPKTVGWFEGCMNNRQIFWE